MKTFIILALMCCIAAAVSVDDAEIKKQDEQVATYVKDCQKKLNITDELYAKIRAGKIENASEDIRCFADCFMHKAGILKDGKLQDEVVLQKMTVRVGEEKAKEILNKCSSKPGSIKCQYGYDLHGCFLANKAY